MPSPNAIIVNLTSSISLDTAVVRVTTGYQKNKDHLGTFFVLVRVEEIATLVPWADGFASFLEETYYRSIEIDPLVTIERALSITRRHGRAKLQQIIRERRNLNPEATHYCFGAIKDNELWLTHSGSLQAFLLHKFNRAMNGGTRYRWLDVFKTPAPRQTAATDLALSATIVSGPINDKDCFILSTSFIIDIIGLERLEKIMSGRPWENIEADFARHFRTSGGRWTFGCIMLRSGGVEAIKSEEAANLPKFIADNKSKKIANLGYTGGPTKKRLWRIFTALPSYLAGSKKSQSGKITTTPRSSLAWRLGRLVRATGSFSIRILLWLILAPTRFIVSATTKDDRQHLKNSWRIKYDSLLNTTVEYLKSLPTSAQRLLIISLLFAYLFVQSLVFLSVRQERDAEIVSRRAKITGIQEQLDAAESNIIFHNTKKAASLIQDAEERINNLPQKTRDQQRAVAMIRQSLAETRNHLERVVTVDAPVTVGQAAATAFTDPDGFLLLSDQLLLYRGANNSFAVMNIKNGEIKASQVTSVNIGRIKIGQKDEAGRLVFLQDKAGLAVLNLASNTLSAEIIANAKFNAASFGFYNGRLYLLDPAGHQVWRYQKTAAGYGRGAPWLKGNVEDTRDGTALVVDGSIYLLLKNGIVKKFENGNETAAGWSAQTLLTPPAYAERLQSPTNSKSLYALDRASRRIFVWSKADGRLAIQYYAPKLDNLKDFAVDEKNNVIYILNGSEIVKIPLNQNI